MQDEAKIFMQTATKICAIESELVSLFDRRRSAINKMRSALGRNDSQEAFKQLGTWLKLWDQIISKTSDIQKIAAEGAKRDAEARTNNRRESSDGNALAGVRAEAPTKSEA